MPQLSQLAIVYQSQWFWLLLVLATIYFVVGRGIVGKVETTVDARDKQIADDLAAAQAARAAADETEAAWRERMDAARAEAARIASEAKQASARDTEAKVKKAADKLGLKIEASEKKLAEAVQSAHAEIEAVAAELTQDLVSRLTGLAVDKQDAANAVKAELNV